MNEIYEFEGTKYDVAPNRLEEFMVNFPNAVKVDEPGKTIDPALENTGSGSGDGLLEYEFQTKGDKKAWGRSVDGGEMEVVDANEIPEDWFNDPKFKQVYDQENKPQKLKDADAEKTAREALTNFYGDVSGMPKWALPYVTNFTGGAAGLVSGLFKTVESTAENLMGMTADEQREDGVNPVSEALDSFHDFTDAFDTKYYDEKGNTLQVDQLLEKKEYGQALKLASEQAAESAPSMIASVYNPVIGGALMGVSTTGTTYKDDLKNRPEEALNDVIGNAMWAGGSEFLTEWAGGKFFRSLNGLKKSGATEDVIRDHTKNYVTRFVGRTLGSGVGEGITESVNSLIQDGGEVLFYDDKKTQKELISNVINSAVPALLMGGFGGGISSVSKKEKSNVYKFVAPQKWKQEQLNFGKQIYEASNDLDQAEESMKPTFEQDLKNIQKKKKEHEKTLIDSFDSMSDKEIIDYAKNIDAVNKNLNIINNNKYSESAQKKAEQRNVELIQDNLNSIGQEYTGKDIEVEKTIGEALKASEIIEERLKKTKGINKEDLEINILKTEKDIEALSDVNKDGIKNSDGAFIGEDKNGKATIYINQNVAAIAGATNVLGHELLHYMVSRKFKTDNESMAPLVDELKTYLKDNHSDVFGRVQQRIDKFYTKEDGTIKDGALEEYLNVFSDLIATQKIDIKEAQSKGLKNEIKDVMAGFGFGQIKLDSAKDVISFLSTYNKNINRKGLLGKLMGAKILDVSLTSEKLTEGETKSAEKKSISTSKEASDKVQSIYEEQGIAGAMDIIEQFKPIVSRITEKRREAPNYDKELLMSEIEIGERGIFDLISKYDPDSGVPLAAYINKFLPSRAIEASRRVLGEEFTEDVSERVDIAAEEVADVEVEAKPKKKKIILSDRLGVTKEVAEAIKKIVPDLEVNKLNFKTLKNKIPEITGNLFGISPKKLVSGANITKKELQSAQMFISKNADVLISMLPEGATASGTATGVPQTLLKAFYTKTDRAKMAKTGTKAGLAIQVKNNIKKTDFLETFGIIDGKPDRTDRNTSARVLALANQTGKIITNQAVRQEIGKQDAKAKEIISRLKDGKSNVMFSKTSNKLDVARDIFEKANKNEMPSWYKRLPSTQINKISPKTGEMKQYTVRDLEGQFNEIEKAYEARDRVANNFVELFPQWYDMLRTTMGGGITISMFRTTAEFELAVPNPVSKQKTVDRFGYHTDKKLSPKAIAKTKTEEFTNNEKAKLPLLKDFLVDMETYLKENPSDFWFFEEMTRDTQNNMNSIVRIAAPFVSHPISKKGEPVYDKLAIEEHSFPQIVIGRSGILGASAGQIENVWPVIQASYMQMSLLKTDDDFVTDAGLKANLPPVFNKKILPRILNGELDYLPDGYVAFTRYAAVGTKYAPINNGVPIDLNKYELLNGETVAEFFGVDGVMDPETGLLDIVKQNELIIEQLTGDTTKEQIQENKKAKFSKSVNKTKTLNKAIAFSRSAKNETKGITVLDFDDTLATSKSLVISTSPDGVVRKLTAEEFATEGADLLDQGWTHDFSEFSKVVDGKVASLFKKAMKLQGKFGPENMFVLTARPADSAPAIFEFLKANGLNIPLKNITGLANSTSEAKALWIADKVGEGYNDFYFADDALQNVQAVKNMLDQFDVKSKVQQAKVKFSKSMNDKFNDILENVTGIEANKRFSIIKGRKRGESKGKFRVFIPPSHEDFVGLLYNFLGRGKEGNAHRDFFEQALIRPLNRANREYDTARQSVANDYKELNKQFEDVKEKLNKKTPDGDFTFQDAIRVYLWDKHGHKIPGLSETDQTKLAELVMSDPQLQAYAETLNVISKQETYVNPTDGWNGGDIRMDLDDATGRVGRKQFFTEFIENAEIIFSEENLNKIEAGYGKGVRESLEDMLYRIKTGRNRPSGQNEQVNKLMNYLNGSVGTVMFFNMRSALLQQMSIVNYINFADNNIFAAAKAFANQKQYWADFAFIFNSDMLKQRRGGIQTDVNGAELAASLRNSKDITRKLISKLLELGFLPTQIGDNIAIATGGAAYYRNRINKYIKQGMSKKEAETAAFTDFQDITQSTQQSARPDMVSKQQASVIGKVILNFQNVTSQFNRLGKKAFQDIYNRRITKPNTTQMQSDISNAARITYYFAIQNAIFYTLQTALFAMMFDDDEEDVNNLFIKKRERLINGSIDSVLRGTGLIGGVVATLKNVAIAFARQRDVRYNPDESAVGLEALNLSPVIGIKFRKIVNAEKTLNYNKKVIKEMETFDIDNPQWSAVTNYTEAFTNLPLNRLYNKTQNVRQALNNEHSAWERSLMFLGWSQYNLDLENKKMEEIKEKTKGKSKTSGPKERTARERKAKVR